MAKYSRPKISLGEIKKAFRNDLKTSYIGKNPSILGNLLMGEKWSANTRWGKPKEYKQESFKLPSGTNWVAPGSTPNPTPSPIPKLKALQTNKQSLNMRQATRSGGLRMASPSSKFTLGTSITPMRKPTKTPTPTMMAPTPTPAPDERANQYAELINRSSRENGLPKHLLYNLLKQESGFNPSAESGKGAQGIAQIVPKWHPEAGDPFDPEQAIPYAASHLRKSFENFGSWENALAAYNAGGPAVGKYGGIPPYAETENYVAAILAAMEADQERFREDK